MSEEIKFSPFFLDEVELEKVTELLRKCFPKETKFCIKYLKWLYIDNPTGTALGYNAYIGDKLVAHYSCIPMFANIHGNRVKGLLSLNTATDPSCQGKGLFRKLALKTYSDAKEQNYGFVCGVANYRSSPLFVKLLKFKLVAPLEAKVGFGPCFSEGDKIVSKAKFLPIWTDELIKWRVSNPNNECTILSSNKNLVSIKAKSQFGFIDCLGSIVNDDSKKHMLTNENHRPMLSWLKPKLVLALTPSGVKRDGIYMSIPDKYKPSPLNFIFKDLTDSDVNLDKHDVMFSFLDFDAY